MQERGPLRSVGEIDRDMVNKGFPEILWLWERFKRSGRPLESLDAAEIDAARSRSGSPLFGSRAMRWTFALACYATIVWSLQDLIGGSEPLDHTMRFLFAALIVYLFLFILTAIYRSFIAPWKRVVSDDLAFMLSRPSFREWVDQSERGRNTRQKLQDLGINDSWDSASYAECYKMSGGDVKRIEKRGKLEIVRSTLQGILGKKENRSFKPGRYVDSLRQGKASITRFINANSQAFSDLRSGKLNEKTGIALLHSLREQLIQGSAGEAFLTRTLKGLRQSGTLETGVVEAYIWQRDPWVDLTHSRDFYSSASLRGNRFMDMLERRSKGMLGPFGYLHNESMTCLDFRTADGRKVRARLAATTTRIAGKMRTVLFVDAVEGRLNVHPKLLRRAIEDYAKACGFDYVLYHRYPLNRVPVRFVRHVGAEVAQCCEWDIAYVDATSREYLDAFGLPLEPFEYAYPRGKVIGYPVALGTRPVPQEPEPNQLRLAYAMVRDKSILWIISAGAFACLGWILSQYNPQLLAPTGVIACLLVAYDRFLQPRLRRLDSPTQTAKMPRVVEEILDSIRSNPNAIQMSYPERAPTKAEKLLEFFPRPSRRMRHFLEAALYNSSIKPSHLENALKFLRKIEETASIDSLFELLWDQAEPEIREVGLGTDKAARSAAQKEFNRRCDLIRAFLKSTGPDAWNGRQIRKLRDALELNTEQALEVVRLRPRILKGLRKPPRPKYGWIFPGLLSAISVGITIWCFPAWPLWCFQLQFLLLVVPGLWVVCTRLPIAPGVLRYPATRERLKQILGDGWQPSDVVQAMSEAGINTCEYVKPTQYEFKEPGIRIEIRNKRTLEGAMQFLTSSEETGNCIALRNFVSWSLPALLNDETIMLADISMRRGNKRYQQRGQLWMVAGHEGGVPVLTVNSIEFNNEGAKHISTIMATVLEVLRDVAKRSGFKRIYIGISEFGRDWFDSNFEQAAAPQIEKIHTPDLGNCYYFDSYRRSGDSWKYVTKRSLTMRIYALVFGILEQFKGNSAKAKAFLDSAINVNNCWEVTVEPAKEERWKRLDPGLTIPPCSARQNKSKTTQTRSSKKPPGVASTD